MNKLLIRLLTLIVFNAFTYEAAYSAISVKKYVSTVVRKSKSKRAYLLNSDSSELPSLNRIFLLLKGRDHVMAFRVIKQYPDLGQFAAKQVRKYPKYSLLLDGSKFDTIEKVGNIKSSPLTNEDSTDLSDLESSLDLPTEPKTPQPLPESKLPPARPKPVQTDDTSDLENDLNQTPVVTPDEDEEIDDLEDASQLVVEEIEPIDPFFHSLGGEVGFLKNKNISDTNSYYLGGGIRYSLKLLRQIFVSNRQSQDHISLDAGVFIYEVQNFSDTGDSFSVMPLYTGLRYTVLTSDTFGWFLTGGGLYNYVSGFSPVTAKTEDASTHLKGFIPGFGVGFLIKLGPGWEWRVDLGNELIGSGLSLRF